MFPFSYSSSSFSSHSISGAVAEDYKYPLPFHYLPIIHEKYLNNIYYGAWSKGGLSQIKSNVLPDSIIPTILIYL